MKDVTIQHLLGLWKKGKKKYVIDLLENDHPALTAIFLTSCSRENDLSVAESNEIVNNLVDRRMALFQNPVEEAKRYLAILADQVSFLAGLLDNEEFVHTHEVSELRGAANKIKNALL